MSENSLFLTRKDLARRWAIAVSGVDNLRKKLLIPQPIRIGGLLRWNLAAIEAFEDQPSKKSDV